MSRPAVAPPTRGLENFWNAAFLREKILMGLVIGILIVIIVVIVVSRFI